MSTETKVAVRRGMRLESWQENPESTEPTTMSDQQGFWIVALLRSVDKGVPEFEIVFIKLGNEELFWPVPKAAHQDLANVFVQGGSFLKTTMAHMSKEWESIRVTHPQLFSIYEQELIQKIAKTPTGQPPSKPRWTRI